MPRAPLTLLCLLAPLSALATSDAGNGGAPRPPPQCYRINPGGGCCLQNEVDFGDPCPAGYASFDECLNQRNFCPNDPIDAGRRPDAMPPVDTGVRTDAGFPMDAAGRDASAADAQSQDAGDAGTRSSSSGTSSRLPSAGSGCGCAATPGGDAGWAALLLLALAAGRRAGSHGPRSGLAQRRGDAK